MKKAIPFLFVLCIFFFTSCKYDLTPAGTYTGTYNAYGVPSMPVPFGNGTLVITSVDANSYVATLSSPGNPDISFNSAVLTRTNSPTGAWLDLNCGTYNDPSYWYANIYEIDYTGVPWKIEFNYNDTISSISFYGQKQL